MPERTNLYAYTEPTPTDGYPGYVSLNREPDKSVTLTVRSPGHGGTQVGTITLGGVEMVAGGLDPDVLVNRFLAWPLPDEVCADSCASVQGYPGRSGTNLLNANQAKAMLRHVLGA